MYNDQLKINCNMPCACQTAQFWRNGNGGETFPLCHALGGHLRGDSWWYRGRYHTPQLNSNLQHAIQVMHPHRNHTTIQTKVSNYHCIEYDLNSRMEWKIGIGMDCDNGNYISDISLDRYVSMNIKSAW